MVRPGMRATISGVLYPIESWVTQQQGRELEESWTEGWAGGMGEFKRRSRDRYWWAHQMDASQYPNIRLQPRFQQTNTNVTNLSTATPAYIFEAVETGGSTRYIFILAGRRLFKYNTTMSTLHTTVDLAANSVGGRPVLFEGDWYLPLGATNNARQLDVIGAGATQTSGLSLGVTALHFTTVAKDGTEFLARASTINQVDLTATISATPAASDWAADSVAEIGDTTNSITDMQDWGGQIAVSKPDGVYLYDPVGNAHNIQGFVGRTSTAGDTDDGSGGWTDGSVYYWPHSSGLWRFTRSSGTPMGWDADPEWSDQVNRDSQIVENTKRFNSVVTFGRWLYAAKEAQVYYGFRRNDGTVVWHGAIINSTSSTNMYLGIVQLGATAPTLVVVQDNDNFRISLHTDGSLRERSSNFGRGLSGAQSPNGQIWMPQVDFGEPNREKQLRYAWARVQRWEASNDTDLILGVHINDSATFTSLGATFSAAETDYVTTEDGAPNTTLGYTFMLSAKVNTDAGYTPAASDPVIVALGIVAATASVYQVVIPCTIEGLRATSQSVATVHQALRNLLNGPRVAIVEPVQEGAGDTFNGRIVGYREEALATDSSKGPGIGWMITLTIERFDYGGS